MNHKKLFRVQSWTIVYIISSWQ